MSILIDSGPLVALINKRDQWHQWVTNSVKEMKPPFITCEAVLSECTFLLGRSGINLQYLFNFIHRGDIQVKPAFINEIDYQLIHIALDDTEHARLGQWMYRPFTDVVLSPASYKGTVSKKQTLFNGYMELCCFHPNRFQPGDEVLETAGLAKGERFVLLRFVSRQATHDAGHSGITIENKRRAVQEFSKQAWVLISFEEELPDDLKPCKVQIPPHQMHDLTAVGSQPSAVSGPARCKKAGLEPDWRERPARDFSWQLPA